MKSEGWYIIHGHYKSFINRLNHPLKTDFLKIEKFTLKIEINTNQRIYKSPISLQCRKEQKIPRNKIKKQTSINRIINKVKRKIAYKKQTNLIPPGSLSLPYYI